MKAFGKSAVLTLSTKGVRGCNEVNNLVLSIKGMGELSVSPDRWNLSPLAQVLTESTRVTLTMPGGVLAISVEDSWQTGDGELEFSGSFELSGDASLLTGINNFGNHYIKKESMVVTLHSYMSQAEKRSGGVKYPVIAFRQATHRLDPYWKEELMEVAIAASTEYPNHQQQEVLDNWRKKLAEFDDFVILTTL